MRCKGVQALISPYLDHMTDEKETRLVEEHVSGCLACQKFMAQIKMISQTLKSMEQPLIPPGFADDFHRRRQEETRRRFPQNISNYLRPLMLKNAGVRFKHEVVRFYHWRNKTAE